MDFVLLFALVAALIVWLIDGWRTNKWIGELEDRVRRLEDEHEKTRQ